MQKNNLLITALVLIAMGIVGVFSTTWIGGHSSFSGHLTSMMMDGGMMGRHPMKGMMQEMMSGILPPGVKAESLPDPESPGAKLTSTYCAQCHNLPSPLMHSAEDWPSVAGRMIARERMMGGFSGMMMEVKAPSSQEEEVLLEYLRSHAMKALPPGTVPSPDSPNTALFQRTCSRCHALPDPKQHTADEWPGVVERMRKNMEIMGKTAITDQQRDGLVEYLRMNPRK